MISELWILSHVSFTLERFFEFVICYDQMLQTQGQVLSVQRLFMSDADDNVSIPKLNCKSPQIAELASQMPDLLFPCVLHGKGCRTASHNQSNTVTFRCQLHIRASGLNTLAWQDKAWAIHKLHMSLHMSRSSSLRVQPCLCRV